MKVKICHDVRPMTFEIRLSARAEKRLRERAKASGLDLAESSEGSSKPRPVNRPSMRFWRPCAPISPEAGWAKKRSCSSAQTSWTRSGRRSRLRA